MNELEKLEQSIAIKKTRYDYDRIGAMRKDLQGLLGFETVLRELIQNADDAEATCFEIDICDDSFYVGNDAVFTDDNFKYIKKIASANKQDEAKPIGKFGMGFISVFQLCDKAYITSSGCTLRLLPYEGEAEELEFVESRWATTFVLPWVFENTDLRKGLRLEPLQKSQLEDFQNDIIKVFPKAGLFLQHLKTLKASRNGQTIFEIKLEHTSNTLKIFSDDATEEYHYFEWEISDQLKDWLNSNLVKHLRKEKLFILFPKRNSLDFEGELFAYLPTGVKTGLPFHINADFFPTQDRKNLLWEGDARAEWNKKLLSEIASKIPVIMEALKNNPEDVYSFLKAIQKADPQREDLNRFIESCRSNCTKAFQEGEWIYCEDKTWRNLGTSLVHDKKVVQPIRNALRDFCNWHFAHELTATFEQMLEGLGVQTLTLEKYLNGLDGIFPKLNEGLPEDKADRLEQIKPFLQHLHKYENDKLSESKTRLLEISFAIAEDGSIGKASQLYYFEKIHHDALAPWCLESKRISIEWQVLLPHELKKLLPKTDVKDFFKSIVETTPEQMLFYYQAGWQPRQLFNLLHQNNTSWDVIKSLPIFPTQDSKKFCTGSLIVRPGNFTDPFQIGEPLSTEISDEFKEWFDKLGMRKLEQQDYYSRLLPDYFDEPLDDQIKQTIIQFLAKNFQEAKLYLESWKNRKIVFCNDRKWQTPTNVFFRNDLMDEIFGDNYTWIEETFAEAIEVKTLYEYLGIKREAKDIDIVEWLERNASQPVNESTIEIRRKILEHISNKEQRGTGFKEISRLLNLSWLPDNTNIPRWHLSEKLYNRSWSEHMRYPLVAGKYFCRFEIPSALEKSFKMLVPNIEMLVKHLEEVYKRGEWISEKTLQMLESCPISLSYYVGRLQKLPLISNHLPNCFFFDDPKLGNWRFVYPQKHSEKYRNLTKLLGIKSKPQRDDFIDVLLEIAEKFDDLKADKKEEASKVVKDCLENLAAIYREEQRKPESSMAWLQKIQGLKIIPHQGSLVKASTVAIRDLGDDAIKRYALDDVEHLLVRLRGDTGFYERLGVKSLKACLELEFVQTQGEKLNLDLQKILIDKKSVIIRVILHEKKRSLKDIIKFYEELKPFTSDQILVRRTVRIQEQPLIKKLPFEFAYDKKSKRLMVRSPNLEFLQGAIAEAFEIKDSNVKLNLETILESQKTIQEDHEKLDRLDFPPLPEEFQLALIPSPTLEIIDVEVASNVVGNITQKVADSSNSLPPTNTSVSQSLQTQRPNTPTNHRPESKSPNLGTALNELPSVKPQEPSNASAAKSLLRKPKTNQPQKRFTFVYAEREKQDHEKRQESTTQETDKRGMELAKEYELSQGRIPDDSPSRDKGCGYDIESTSVDGTEKRLIELKTTGSFWRERGVTMTPNEFQKAMRLGSQYWLYVIEDLNGQPRLYRIQNLEDNIQSIVFDGVWKDIAELDDESSS
jgi:hypothetical protein